MATFHWTIVKVKGSGLSYDVSEVDGNRCFTRAVTELKPYNTRESLPPPVQILSKPSSERQTPCKIKYFLPSNYALGAFSWRSFTNYLKFNLFL